MTRYACGEYTLRRRQLRISDGSFFVLPFGNGLDPETHTIDLRPGRNGETQIFARDGKTSDRWIEIFPPYRDVNQRIGNKDNVLYRWRPSPPRFGNIPLEVWVVDSDRDRATARAIVDRTHYLTAPNSGMILAIRFRNSKQQLKVRDSLRPTDLSSRSSPAWFDEPGRMVGCAVLQTLLHGVPKGREIFANRILGANWRHDLLASERRRRRLGRGPRPGEPTRRDIVRKLGLVWASRFAVDEPYRGLGLGRILAGCALRVAGHHRLPPGKRVEAVRVTSNRRFVALSNSEEQDFLTAAGYTLCPTPLSSASVMRLDEDSGNLEPLTNEGDPIRGCKLYYYASL